LGIWTPTAASTALTEDKAWVYVQTPQDRCHEMVRITRIAPLENQLDAAEHLARAPGIDDLASGHFHFDAKVAFDSGDWINYNSFTHISPPIIAKGYLFKTGAYISS
jgi:hypothetical protein